jgi:hypothetical protein
MNNHEFVPGHNGYCEKCGDNEAEHPGYVDIDALIDEQAATITQQAVTITRLVAVLGEAEEALSDYVERLEKQGAILRYGHSVIATIKRVLSETSQPTKKG